MVGSGERGVRESSVQPNVSQFNDNNFLSFLLVFNHPLEHFLTKF